MKLYDYENWAKRQFRKAKPEDQATALGREHDALLEKRSVLEVELAKAERAAERYRTELTKTNERIAAVASVLERRGA